MSDEEKAISRSRCTLAAPEIARILMPFCSKPSFVQYVIKHPSKMEKNALQIPLLVANKGVVVALAGIGPMSQSQASSALHIVADIKLGDGDARKAEKGWTKLMDDGVQEEWADTYGTKLRVMVRHYKQALVKKQGEMEGWLQQMHALDEPELPPVAKKAKKNHLVAPRELIIQFDRELLKPIRYPIAKPNLRELGSIRVPKGPPATTAILAVFKDGEKALSITVEEYNTLVGLKKGGADKDAKPAATASSSAAAAPAISTHLPSGKKKGKLPKNRVFEMVTDTMQEVVVRWRADRGPLDAWIISLLVDKRSKCQLSPARLVSSSAGAEKPNLNAFSEAIMTKLAKLFAQGTVSITNLYKERNALLAKDGYSCNDSRKSPSPEANLKMGNSNPKNKN